MEESERSLPWGVDLESDKAQDAESEEWSSQGSALETEESETSVSNKSMLAFSTSVAKCNLNCRSASAAA